MIIFPRVFQIKVIGSVWTMSISYLLAQGEVPLFGSEKCRETCPEACDARVFTMAHLGVDISRVEPSENVVGG